MIPALVVALVLLALPLHDAIRRPSLRRFALRNLVRRRSEALLVVFGSLLGTAIITAALIVGATFETSIRDIARTQLGPVDERVVLQSAAQQDQLMQSLKADPIPGVDGALPVDWANVSVATVGADRRAEPGRRMFELDVHAAQRFGGDPGAAGFEGVRSTPGKGEAILNRDLAKTLDVHEGQQVDVFLYGETLRLRVGKVVPQIGVAGTGSVFVQPGTIEQVRRDSAASATAEPPHTEVFVSNDGGVFSGADHTTAVTRELEARVAGLPGASVDKTKREVVDHAVASGRNIGSLFTLVGLFSVLAGVLLLVNLFVMLAEERKPELGMMRAVGLKRNLLLRAFTLEGACYGLTASLFGVAVGTLLGWLMVGFTKGLFTNKDDLTLRFSAPAQALIAGGALGLAILLATAYATSARISRLNVISAIRDLPDPRHRRHQLRRMVLGTVGIVVGGAATAAGLLAPVPMLALLGPPLACVSAIPMLQGVAGRRKTAGALSIIAMGWCLFAFTLAPGAMDNAGVEVFAVQGIVLVGAGVVIAAHVDRVWVVAVEHLARVGGGLAARLGLAYPLARKFRTAMLLGMYALVLFTITFLATFSHILGNQESAFAASASAGTNLLVTSNPSNPAPASVLKQQKGVTDVALLTTALGKARNATHGDEDTAVTGFDENLLRHGEPRLEARSSAYSSDRAAYEAVLNDPGAAIVDSGLFGQRDTGPQNNSVPVGSTITVTDPGSGQSRTLRVVGRLERDPASTGILVSTPTVQDLFGSSAVASRAFVTTAPGVDADQVAQRLNAELVAHGVEAHTFTGLVHDSLSTQLGLFKLMEGYLGLGLVIGIAGLGVVMVRAVRERRHEIGMLRAVGFQAGVVRRAFLIESTFIALQGIVIGVAMGLLTAHQILSDNGLLTGDPLPFSVPWALLAMLCVIPLLGSMAAAIIPAGNASAIRPAVALRLADA